MVVLLIVFLIVCFVVDWFIDVFDEVNLICLGISMIVNFSLQNVEEVEEEMFQ